MFFKDPCLSSSHLSSTFWASCRERKTEGVTRTLEKSSNFFPHPTLSPPPEKGLIKNENKKKIFCQKKEVFRQSLSASISQLSKLPCPESDSRFHKLTENPSSQEPKLSLLCLQLWFRIGARLFTVLINAPFQCGIGEGKWTDLINRCSCSVLYLGSFRTCNRLIRLDWTWTS